MALEEYKRKRDFHRTPEPAGKKVAGKGRSLVVQKHAASRLHYDFRLELDGVLKSWAVPKGPSLDPSQKRLAMHVEDHPVEYGKFEGIIPEGEYGGGTVMLWDRGRWEPTEDPREGYRQGKLKFQLHGEKLHGGWYLVRKSARSRTGDDEKAWFLIKQRDEEARPLEEGDILEQEPLSVVSGRSLDEIAAQQDRIWSSKPRKRGKRSSATKSNTKAKSKSRRVNGNRKPPSTAKLPKSARGTLPAFVQPQLATLVKSAPEGDPWLHEMKFDGYRMLCRIENKHVQFLSRNEQNWTDKFPSLVEAAGRLSAKTALLDGEVVVMEKDGTTNFQSLQNAFREHHTEKLVFFAFDLLHLNGHDLRSLPLEERKQLLAQWLGVNDDGPIRYSEHVAGGGPKFFQHACKLGLEGIISKRRDRPYQAGRGYDWLKVKCVQREEFVIGGFTEPGGSRHGFGALLIGYHNGDEKLIYGGKVGTGFDARTLEDLHRRMQPLEQEMSPFTKAPRMRGVHWIKPKLVAQIEFSQWTRDGRLRHPSFQGLRLDKPAKDVVQEEPVPVKTATQASSKGKKRHESKAPHASRDEFAGVRLTSPDKILYPEQGITKLDLAAYYHAISDWILPHIAGRPLVLVRCPEGRAKKCFYQKHPTAGTPENLRQIPIKEKSGTENYAVADEAGDLISLAQIGALEIHTWGSRADKLERPDRLVFDLDPDPSVKWDRVVESAIQIRQFLEEFELTSFVKTTGGKGLHVVLPIERRTDWDDAKEFCRQVAELIVQADPQHYTSNMSKAARHGKIFVDYLRNGRGATSIAAYSTRAKPGAPVSMPLSWKELLKIESASQFNLQNTPARLASLRSDPWQEIHTTKQSLTASLRKHVASLLKR